MIYSDLYDFLYPYKKLSLAEIQEKLIAKDIEWLSQDESIDYYIDRKSIAVKRKKLFLLHGLETAFGRRIAGDS